MKRFVIFFGLVLLITIAVFAQQIERVEWDSPGSLIRIRLAGGGIEMNPRGSDLQGAIIVGWSRDFFVLHNPNRGWIRTYDTKGSRIAELANSQIGDSSVSLSGDTVVVTRGGSTQRLNKNLR